MAMAEKTIQSLREYLEEKAPVSSGFKIENDEQANWALRKIMHIEEEIEASRELADAEIKKIKSWLEKTEKQLNNDKEYFEELLLEYAKQEKIHEQRKKSKALPNGRIRFRKVPAKWEMDNKKVVEELERIGRTDLIRIKKEPKKTDIKRELVVNKGKAVLPETGEVIDGITVLDQGLKFEVKVGE